MIDLIKRLGSASSIFFGPTKNISKQLFASMQSKKIELKIRVLFFFGADTSVTDKNDQSEFRIQSSEFRNAVKTKTQL